MPVSTGGSIPVSGPPGAVRSQLRVHFGGRYNQLPVTCSKTASGSQSYDDEPIRALDFDLTKICQPLHL